MIRDFPDDVDLQKACGMYGKNAIYKLKYRKWVFNMSTWGQNITFCPLSIRFDKFNLINSYNYWTNNTKSAPKFVTFSIQFLSLETAGLKVMAVKSDYKMYNQQHQERMVLDKNNWILNLIFSPTFLFEHPFLAQSGILHILQISAFYFPTFERADCTTYALSVGRCYY